MAAGIGLADVVADLRSELAAAAAAAAAGDSRIRFEVGPVELTLSVQVTRETTPGAKVKFWVVEAGADVSISKSSTQQITLTLSPVDTAPDQSNSDQSDPDQPTGQLPRSSVWIEGQSVPGER